MFPPLRLTRNTGMAALLLGLVCAFLLLPGLGEPPVQRQQELRVLLGARDMAEGGSWLIPHFMGEERLRKPPLMYWLVATAFKLAGTTESAAAGRLASAVAGTALVLATFLCGRRLVGRRAAFLGGLVLLTSIGFMYHARLAETDIAQALFCSLALFALHAALTARGGRAGTAAAVPWLLAGVCAGIGFMVKGPASLVMPVAAAVTFLLATRAGRDHGRRSGPPGDIVRGALLALLLFAVLASPWYIAVYLQSASNTDAQAGNEIARLLSESSHRGSVFYYVYTLPARLGVWALAWPVAVAAAWLRLRHHAGPRFVLCWLASSFAILSALSSKQSHYALLLFVPSALLVGWLLDRATRRVPTVGKPAAGDFQSLEVAPGRRHRLATFAHWHLVVLCLVALLVGIVLAILWLRRLPIAWPRELGVAGLLMAAGALVALWALVVRRSAVAPVLVLALVLAYGTGFHARRLARITDGDNAVAELVTLNRNLIAKAPRFLVVGPHASLAAWYAHRLPDVLKVAPEEAWSRLRDGDVLLCSSRKRPIDVSSVPAVPAARRGYMDVHAYLFRKPAEASPP